MAKNLIKVIIALLTLAGLSNAAYANDDTYSLGVRGNVMLEDGVPANDMLGFGLYGKYYLEDNWAIGYGIDAYSYDFENTAEFVGLEGTKIIDAKVSSTMISAWAEKSYKWSENTRWFWNAGAGINDVSVDPVTGTLTGGGTYLINTDAGTEFVLLASLGTTWRFSKNWGTEISAHIEQHFADWKVTDSSSGATKTLDSYTPMGIQFGINYYF